MPNTETIEDELQSVLTGSEYLSLVEHFGGRRVYLADIGSSRPGKIERHVGKKAALAIKERFGCGDYISVPVARLFRAKAYRQSGLSYASIAQKLGMSESGVAAIFARVRRSRSIEILQDRQKMGAADAAASRHMIDGDN